jgi:hypothetical protein
MAQSILTEQSDGTLTNKLCQIEHSKTPQKAFQTLQFGMVPAPYYQFHLRWPTDPKAPLLFYVLKVIDRQRKVPQGVNHNIRI